MKKLIILGVILSLFAFGGNKVESKKVHAAVSQDPQTYATFYRVSTLPPLSYLSDLSAYANNIVSIKVSNKTSDLPTGNYQKVKIDNCTYTNASGVTTTPAEGVIFAYISEATGSTESNKRYDCVLYADVGKIYANEDAKDMFRQFVSLETIDLRMLDVSKTTNLTALFEGNNKLKSIDISTFDTSNVNTFTRMFSNCSSLTSLNLSNFNMSNVEYMNYMFIGCSSLTSVDLSNFNTSNATGLAGMFSGCSSLTSLDLSSFDMSKASSNFNDFLKGCTSLEYLKSPKALASGIGIDLPAQFSPYSGITSLTAANLADHKVINLPGDKFIYEWKNLRTEGGDNGICAALTTGTESNTKLTQLLSDYKKFDAETKGYVDVEIDKEDVTIGESIKYFQDVLDGKQPISGNYNGIKDDTGSFMTISLTEESPYLIAVISLLGILAVLGYYFYTKKKQAN